MTDWSTYLACEVCEAKMGEACYLLLARGPQAGPSIRSETPHSSRKMRGATPQRPRTAPRTTSAPLPARRATRATAAKVAGWAAVARKQGKIL